MSIAAGNTQRFARRVQASSVRPIAAQQGDGRALAGNARGRWRSTLVAVQIAVILVAAGSLMLRTLVNRLQVDLGFDPRGAIRADRSALGASRVDLLRLVFRGAIKVTVAGVVAGAAAAMFATRAIAGMVFGVSAFDPWNLAGAGLLLAIVALASCYPPARSAAAVDPMQLLRD